MGIYGHDLHGESVWNYRNPFLFRLIWPPLEAFGKVSRCSDGYRAESEETGINVKDSVPLVPSCSFCLVKKSPPRFSIFVNYYLCTIDIVKDGAEDPGRIYLGGDFPLFPTTDSRTYPTSY